MGSRRKMKLVAIIFVMTLLCELDAFANKETANYSTPQDPHHSGLLSSINVGVRYSSLLQNRGIILYRDFQIDPVLGLFFLDDRIEYLGDSIGFRDFIWQDRIRLRSRLVSISDDPLFPSHGSIKNSSPDRPETYEWSNTVEFFIPGYNESYLSEIDLTYAKDIAKTMGNFLELQAKIKLFEFRVPMFSTKIEPNIFSSIGWGDKAHNKFFYGPSSDSSGFNNVAFGIWFALPEEADRFYPIIQIKHFRVLDEYKNSEFAKDRSDGWLFSFIATYGFL